jgi:glycosyltransferase involved in cell wall biosynthesis
MNILFITPGIVQPLNGGIERTTLALSQALHDFYGHVSSFRSLEDNYTEDQWASYIEERKIDIIIAQGADKRIAQLLPLLRRIINNINHKIVLLFAFHSNPGVELISMDYAALFNRLVHGVDVKANLQQLAWQIGKPIMYRGMMSHLRDKYRLPYNYADKVILLSKNYIPEYRAISGGEEDRFLAIPNMFPFPEDTKPAESKTKTILIVSRMEERQKRIKLAIKIWHSIAHKGWNLKIVGAGEELDYYKCLANKWHVKDISFEGRQNSIPYYQEAQIFMMTSSCEGLPMTILEAQQCGCVPIVFDTFASLPDVVTDGSNGFVVAEGDEEQYMSRLTQLMNDEALRKQMAKKGYSDSRRFAPSKVAAQWDKLFNELINQG